MFNKEEGGRRAAACRAGDTADAGIFEVGGRDDIIMLALNRLGRSESDILGFKNSTRSVMPHELSSLNKSTTLDLLKHMYQNTVPYF